MSTHPLDRPLRTLLPANDVKVLGAKLGLHTVGDLLQHYPRRYATRGELTDLAGLVEGDDVTIVAEVVSVRSRPMQRKKGTIVEVVVTDGSGRLTLTFFNQRWRDKQLGPGARGMFAGKVSRFGGKLQLTHPEFVPLPDHDGPEDGSEADAGPGSRADQLARELIPVYPAASNLPSWKVSKAVDLVLPVADELDEPLPEALPGKLGLLPLGEAYRAIHRPVDSEAVDRARARLRFDEAFALQTVLAQRRNSLAQQSAVPRRPRPDGLLEAFDARLPFTLTHGQREVGE